MKKVVFSFLFIIILIINFSCNTKNGNFNFLYEKSISTNGENIQIDDSVYFIQSSNLFSEKTFSVSVFKDGLDERAIFFKKQGTKWMSGKNGHLLVPTNEEKKLIDKLCLAINK
jgi:hypothetical protein